MTARIRPPSKSIGKKTAQKRAREVKAKGKDDMEARKKVHIKFHEVMKGVA
mgnify:CR=1 FL=1